MRRFLLVPHLCIALASACDSGQAARSPSSQTLPPPAVQAIGVAEPPLTAEDTMVTAAAGLTVEDTMATGASSSPAAPASGSLTAQTVAGVWIPRYETGGRRHLRLDPGGTYEIYSAWSEEGFEGRTEKRRTIESGRFRLRDAEQGQLICFQPQGNGGQSARCGRVRMPTATTVLWDWVAPRFGAEAYRRPGTPVGA